MANKGTEKILITGANGQLGTAFRELESSFPSYEFIFVTHAELPMDQFGLVEEYFSRNSLQYCINCAAYTGVDNAEKKEESNTVFKVNADAVSLLAGICRENHTRLVHISTDYVFDGKSSRPYKETDPAHPLNVYGASKLAGEKQAFEANPDLIIIRSSWVYAASGKNFVKTMLRLMGEKTEINVVNDQMGSPTYAPDIANAIMNILSMHKWLPGIYHYTNKGVISWYEFALAIKSFSGSNCFIHPIPSSAYPVPAKRPMYSVLDSTKIQETFGIHLIDWKESLEKCIKRIHSS